MSRGERPLLRLILALLLLAPAAWADPIPVQHVQGSARGFLIIKDEQGHRLGYGDLVQVVHGSRVQSRLTFHFRDGSVDDEETIYTQRRRFALVSDHHIQKGPSFPKPIDVLVNAAGKTVTSRWVDKDGKEKVETQQLEMPPDVSNGMALILIGNISPTAETTTLTYVASTESKSRLVHLLIHPGGREPLLVAGSHRYAEHFVIHIELGGVTGMVAPLIGKQPQDVHVWIYPGTVPVVLAEQGQLYQGGPIWRIELTSPTWLPQAAH
ncbi:MAG TPA: hypothetical protein VGD62_09140 [Acidobacteriaceae bacterium]